MKQDEAVLSALEKLGGVSTLERLNQETLKIKDCIWKTKTPFASIRRIVQLNKNIYKIKPGLYGLIKCKKDNEAKGIFEETSKNKNSKEVIEFNHSYYQGLLVTVGNLRGLKTFIPNQDKNKKFIDKNLGELRSLNSIPNFSFDIFVKKSSSIDVIWFNEREMPHSFFEIEHSTDIQNSLLKFHELQDFSTRMIIVADSSRRKDYENKIRYSSFKDIFGRIQFLDYMGLNKQYEQELEKLNFSLVI